MEFEDVYRPRRRRGWLLPSCAALGVLACCASVAVDRAWNGRGTMDLTLDGAMRVMEDPRSTDNQRLLAEVRVWREVQRGNHAETMLRGIAERSDAAGEQARKHINLLKR
jgi:hypothetical protein